ncbi:response regulator transcription factor [Nocardioides sp. IC4_145]|uniref:LuxR C-terminal-related transcriptional regulator n=1 Tax=Nocardioides sp. IC4_145 TaxID=2714037 RepID=UPI00140BC1E3|nr:LuxR C-terminal-related transcriptional regulator [Nocardioides sp. IC4_145]NHC25508.1 response regulator transcription factor [Nocardioides sp. IC4_145]
MTGATVRRPPARVAIVEDHTLFADSLDLALTMEHYEVRRVSVRGTNSSLASVQATVLAARPRIVLLDLDLGHLGDGARLIAPLAAAGLNIVVVTASSSRARWGECVHLGARKVMSKAQPLNEILAVVRKLSRGSVVMDVAEREALLHSWREQRGEKQRARARLERLTRREREVLGLLVEGRTVREIAQQGVVSEATVRTQVKSILAKLEVSSQLAAVGLAHHVGWATPDH